MDVADIAVAAWVVLFCGGGWMTHALLLMYTSRVVPLMESLSAPEPASWPRVSMIIPACNEGDTLEAALQSVLKEDYPNLEIVLIDDRSSDATPQIVDRLAATDERVMPMHIKELPEGWLGKVNALHQGVLSSTGEWALLTDADVHYVPGTLRKVIAWAEAEKKDFVTALPHVQAKSLWLHVAVLALGELMAVAAKLWTIGKPGSDAYAGVGPFNLMRRTVFDRSEGFEWLKMEISEDIGVGLMMQRAGAKMAIVNARNQLLWEWYPTVGHLVRGLEKNSFALYGQYRYWQAYMFVVLLILTALAPFAAGLTTQVWVWAIGGAALLLHVMYAAVYSRWIGAPFVAGLLIPIGKLMLAWILARAAWVFWRRGGVNWRGTSYSVDQLKAGHRVEH